MSNIFLYLLHVCCFPLCHKKAIISARNDFLKVMMIGSLRLIALRFIWILFFTFSIFYISFNLTPPANIISSIHLRYIFFFLLCYSFFFCCNMFFFWFFCSITSCTSVKFVYDKLVGFAWME